MFTGATFVLDSSLTGDKREKMKEKIKAFGGILDKRVSSSKTLAVIGNINFQLFVYISTSMSAVYYFN